jgi:hypothetical protein
MNTNKIMKISCLLKWSALLLCAALPLMEAGYWITNGYPFLSPFFSFNEALWGMGEHAITWAKINDMQKFLGFLIDLIPMVFSIAALFYLSQVFAAFQRKELFEKKNVQILKKAGWALVWGQIVYPFHSAALSLAMTYRNPVGERQIAVGFGSDQFKILAIGLSILLISWVFEEAVKLREEQEGVV